MNILGHVFGFPDNSQETKKWEQTKPFKDVKTLSSYYVVQVFHDGVPQNKWKIISTVFPSKFPPEYTSFEEAKNICDIYNKPEVTVSYKRVYP